MFEFQNNISVKKTGTTESRSY